MAYKYTNSKGVTYYLQQSTTPLRGGKMQTIYFFTKTETSPKGTPVEELPADRFVKESPRNGFLTLAKVKPEDSAAA